MTSASPKLPPKPGQNVPLQQSDGTMNPVWYAWLSTLETIVKKLREEV